MEIYYILALIIPSLTFFYMYAFWKKYGKDENPKNVVIQTELPKGINSAMADYIFDNRFTYQRYLISTIIEMAVNGFIVLDINSKTNKIIKFSTKEKDFKKNKVYESVVDYLRVFLNEDHQEYIKNHAKKMENIVSYEIKKMSKYTIVMLVVIILSSLLTITMAIFVWKEKLIFEFDFGEIFFQILILMVIFFLLILLFAIIPFYILKIINRKNKTSNISFTNELKNQIVQESYSRVKKNVSLSDSYLKKIKDTIKEDIKIFYIKDDFRKQGIYLFLKSYANIGIASSIFLFIVFLSLVKHSNQDIVFSFISNNSEISLIIISIFFLPSFIIFFFDKVMSKRNIQGTEIYRQLLGFKKYLSLKEKLNSAEATQELFEKYFPYAIVLGVRDEWANRFSKAYISVPKWFITKDKHGNFLNLNTSNSVEIANKIYSAVSSTFVTNETSSK